LKINPVYRIGDLLLGDCPGSLFRLFLIISDLFRCSLRDKSLYDHCCTIRKLPVVRITETTYVRFMSVLVCTRTVSTDRYHLPRDEELFMESWTVPTDTYHLPRDVELFDPPRPKGPYPSGDGHYWRGASSFMKSIMIWIT